MCDLRFFANQVEYSVRKNIKWFCILICSPIKSQPNSTFLLLVLKLFLKNSNFVIAYFTLNKIKCNLISSNFFMTHQIIVFLLRYIKFHQNSLIFVYFTTFNCQTEISKKLPVVIRRLLHVLVAKQSFH